MSSGGQGTALARTRTRSRARVAGVALFVALAAGAAVTLALHGAGHTAHRAVTGAQGVFRPDSTRLSDCRAGQVRCMAQAYGNVSYRSGPQVALAQLDRELAGDPTAWTRCHGIAHTIGAAALARGGGIGRAFAQGSATCESGYYHGVLQYAVAGVPPAQLAARVQHLCDASQLGNQGFLLNMCLHGLGHGVMLQARYDLPRALATCRSLGSFRMHQCANGVVMENYSSRFNGMRRPWLRAAEPLYPCTAPVVDAALKGDCYSTQSGWVMQQVGNWGKAARICGSGEVRWRGRCFQEVGDIAARRARYDATAVRRVCAGMGAAQAACLLGGAQSIAFHTGAAAVTAQTLCATVAGDDLLRACLYGATTPLLAHSGSRAELQRQCAAIDPRWTGDCMRRTAPAGVGI